MPRTKKKATPSPHPRSGAEANGLQSEVLTLEEAAAFLRLPATEVLRLVEEQGLPTRRVGKEWRFLKTAIQVWLSAPLRSQGIWAAAGMLKEDPYLEEMLQEIERMRGGSVAEEQ